MPVVMAMQRGAIRDRTLLPTPSSVPQAQHSWLREQQFLHWSESWTLQALWLHFYNMVAHKLIPILKKGNAKECSNYRMMALISHARKVVPQILQARLQQYMNHEFPDVQAGFRKGRGTRDQISIKAMVFPVVIYGCESWTVKKAKRWRIDAFELWCWRRLLRVPWTARRFNLFILKEISPGI